MGAAAVLAPAFVYAQTSTTGLLNVYVQVINQSGYSYTPGNFTVSVSGQNPSPSTFQGSQSGTLVSLNPGSYSVTLTNVQNFNPSYSVGCNGTIAAAETKTCVVTLNTGSYAYPYPTPYPYPYNYVQPLTCRTDTPTVGLGQQARFSAVGGVGGTYNWFAESQTHFNVGPVFNKSFNSSGTHTVQVTNAAQTATCVVTVTNTYYPQPTTPAYVYPYGSTTYPYGGTSYTAPYQPTYTSTYYPYPRFPNTGFEPITSAQLAFAVVLLMGAAIAAYPYARKAFALAVR